MKRVRLILSIAILLAVVGCATVPASKTHSTSAVRTSPFLNETSVADIERRLKTLTNDGDVYTLAVLYDKTGRPEPAFEAYLQTIEKARHTAGLHWEGIGAALGLVKLRRRVKSFESRATPFLDRWSRDPGYLAPEAAFQLRNLLFSFALKRRDKQATDLLHASGCITEWALAGPIASDKRGKAAQRKLKENKLWPKTVDAGGGTAPIPVEYRKADVCQISPQPTPSTAAGTVIGRSSLHLDSPGQIRIRLQTTAEVQLYINRQKVYEQRIQDKWVPETRWLTVWLPAGIHEIVLSVYSPDVAPIYSLSATNEAQQAVSGNHATQTVTNTYAPAAASPIAEVEATTESALLAEMTYAIWNVDPYKWQTLKGVLDDTRPLHRMLLADYQLMTPFNAIEVGMENARVLYAGAIEKMPTLYEAAVYLAKHAQRNGRIDEAIATLETAAAQIPDEPILYLTLADFLNDTQWSQEMRRALDHAAELLGDNCEVLQWQYALTLTEMAFDDAFKLSQRIQSCAASSEALATEYTRQGKLIESTRELTRIAAAQPNSIDAQLNAALANLREGNSSQGIAALKKITRQFPLAIAPYAHLADAYMATHQQEKAEQICERQSLFPIQPALFHTCEVVAQKNRMAPYRVDGIAVVRRFMAQTNKPETDFAWVLDRMVWRMDRFGSGVQLIHSIGYVNSQDAVTEYGELQVPPGALVLQARVIKPNLDLVYPVEMENKTGLSLPNLSVGDFVELETVSAIPPHSVFRGGFDTEFFYFKDFNTRFVRSEMVVIAPSSFELQFDSRGESPIPEQRIVDDMQVVTFRARNVPPLRSEPDTPDAKEFLPSVRVTAHANRQSICNWMNEQLYTTTQWTPEIELFLKSSIVTRKPTDQVKEIEAVYNWITLNIDEDMILFDPASQVFSRKRGSRARLFQQMLSQLGISSELGLATTAFDDHSPYVVPDMNRYTVPVVRLGNGMWVSFQDRYGMLGTLPSELQHQSVLMLKNCELATTDSGRAPFDTADVAATLSVDKDGNASGTITESLAGEKAAVLRALFESPTSEHQQLVEEHLLAGLFPEAIMADFSIANIHNREKPLIFTYHVTIPGLLNNARRSKQLRLPMPIQFTQYTGSIAERALPLILATHTRESRHIEITIPNSKKVNALPPESCADAKKTNAHYCMSFHEPTPGKIEIELNATMDAERVSPEDYRDFRDFVLITEQMNSASIDIR